MYTIVVVNHRGQLSVVYELFLCGIHASHVCCDAIELQRQKPHNRHIEDRNRIKRRQVGENEVGCMGDVDSLHQNVDGQIHIELDDEEERVIDERECEQAPIQSPVPDEKETIFGLQKLPIPCP